MIFKQEKYCDCCGKWYLYDSVGSPNPAKHCSDCGGNGRDSCIIGVVETVEKSINAFVFDNELYGYKVCTVSTANYNIGNFKMPSELGELISIKLLVLSDIDIVDGDIYIKIKKHLEGESIIPDETNWAKKITLSDGKISGYDLSDLFIDVVAGQYCSVRLQNACGQDINILSVDINYTINTSSYNGS